VLAAVLVLAVHHRFLLDQVRIVGLADASGDVRGYRVRLGLGFGQRVGGDRLFGPVGLGYLGGGVSELERDMALLDGHSVVDQGLVHLMPPRNNPSAQPRHTDRLGEQHPTLRGMLALYMACMPCTA
jgi:hypothetical protein